MKLESSKSAADDPFRTLVEQSIVGIYLIQEENAFAYVNPKMAEIFGCTQDEMTSRPLLDFIAAEDRELVRNNVRRRLDGTTPSIHYRLRMLRKDGTPIHAEVHGTRIVYMGRPAILGTLLDITERVKAEHTLQEIEQQRRQSQKMEAIGQLAGGIAHDFNNLLTVINGRSEMAISRLNANDPLRDELKLIFKAGERGAALTQQLLAFSRRQILQPKAIDLNSIVNEMSMLLKRLLFKNIELITVLQSGLSPIEADPGQIEQVLINLAVNARDAMRQGGKLLLQTSTVVLGEMPARSDPDFKAGTYVQICVTDTGCGMEESVLSHIFEPFFTTKEPGNGTGLGLATVYGIVKQSKGYVEVESAPGKGSTFRIYLPAVKGPVVAPQTVSAAIVSPRGAETILLVEDEPSVREMMREILAALGYSVICAGHAAEALQLYETHSGAPHLLVTDVIMPGMNGTELAHCLIKRQPGLKVLLVSGYMEHALSSDSQASGVEFIQKPFTPASLAQKVRQVLDKAHRPPPA